MSSDPDQPTSLNEAHARNASVRVTLEGMLAINANVIEEFRANGGKVSGMFANEPLLLLTTTGAKSGQKRTNPLVHTTDGDRVVIIASFGGAPTHPAWFLNIRANPEVTIELPGESFTSKAVIPEGEERQRIYDQHAAQMPRFADYQAMTAREIPVVVIPRR
ncbi:MAG: nitroreductase family deazaflavin-dependent oxidoreductase [Chloroflexi bacterium]|nr:nitroreductase family deazaflavin-dependent oxidoreductase [Chloroflexota bacterium]